MQSEEAITGNIEFYPYESDKYRSMWQNSSIRGFLNGTDVRDIHYNGNRKYSAPRGGNFTGQCNFLNEAFNLSREPIIEYAIPDSEDEIPDGAFNGCITLKKLTIHPKITNIGKKAFEGVNFRYAYKYKDGSIILSQEQLKDNEKYEQVIDITKLKRNFEGFDYNILIDIEKTNEAIELANMLNKYKFKIPYVYALELIQNGMSKTFFENSDFRFFKSELPKIHEMLLDYSEEEVLDFYKFANALGCFSNEKILDKNGKKTEAILGQKASSLLAQLIKTKKMGLRKLS